MTTGRVRTVALRKQRQEDHDKFKVSLAYVVRPVEERLVIRGGKDIVLWLQRVWPRMYDKSWGNVKCFPQSLNSQP